MIGVQSAAEVSQINMEKPCRKSRNEADSRYQPRFSPIVIGWLRNLCVFDKAQESRKASSIRGCLPRTGMRPLKSRIWMERRSLTSRYGSCQPLDCVSWSNYRIPSIASVLTKVQRFAASITSLGDFATRLMIRGMHTTNISEINLANTKLMAQPPTPLKASLRHAPRLA